MEGRKFVRSPGETGKKGEWVLYERGAPQNEGTRRWLTKKVLVELKPGQAAADLKKVAGVSKTEARGKYAVVEFGGNPDAALAGAEILRKQTGVRSAEPMLARQWFRRWVPNDPLFSYSATNPGYQWHLHNTGQFGGTAGIDVNVVPAWENYRGAGVRIGIVDDGLEVNHPDLASNVDLVNGHNFNSGDPDDPSPGLGDFHGTSCAGVAAARGNNGIGVSGSAPEATLVGLRLIAEPTTDDQEAEGIAFKNDIIEIKSNSWGPYDTSIGNGGPGPLAQAALLDAVTNGRDGKGTVFLWAAGNGNYNGDDSNYDGWANAPYAIAVSAVNDKGRSSWYSEPGANILVCAPSSGGKEGITTTDSTGSGGYNEDGGTAESPDYTDCDYTNTFGGTSSATPTVAGVVALMLQANPSLTYRDVQEILVRTARQNDEYDSGWVTNGGGFHFHDRYGAGLVDAQQAVITAATWTNLAPQVSRSIPYTGIRQSIPDASDAGGAHTFTISAGDNLRLEHVMVHAKVTHPYVGNLEWRLTSPSGVTVELARARFNDTTANLDWTFMTTHFRGERSQGDWKLQVFDRMIDYTGTLDEATITFYGTVDTSPEPVPVITSNWIVVGREGWPIDHQVTASNFPTSFAYWGSLPSWLTFDSVNGRFTGTPTNIPPGSQTVFADYLTASNSSGMGKLLQYFLILPGSPALSAAVEQPESTKIIPFGYGDPFSQTAVTHDGVDAIESATVNEEEYSGIEFTVDGPAKLEFWWKVSSEKNYDYLILAVDGYVRDYISGEVDWTNSTTYLGPGLHNVDIYYSKDQGVSKGQDRGWIDELTITPTGEVPAIKTDTVTAYRGAYFRYQLAATNAPSSWVADNLPSGLTLHEPTGLIYGSVAAAGAYPVTIHATNGFGTTTKTIAINIGTVAEGLAASLDMPSQIFVTSGDQGWLPQQLYSSDGQDAARSGPIGDLQQSIMTTQVNGPCKVVFYWGVSSEAGYDFLRFYIDNVEQAAISGEVGWTCKSAQVPRGLHTLKWAYTKDDFTASGLDAGFVDQLSILADTDGDSVCDALETWFGTDPGNPIDYPNLVITYAAGSTTLQFPSMPGNDYIIEYSSDLVNWTSVTEHVPATASITTWTDPNAPDKTHRFYRVVVP